MKTAEIKDLLKKEVLIIELPEDTQFDVLVDNPLWKNGIKFLTGTEEKFHFIEGSYTLLGKPDEIREEDAEKLVESWESVAEDGTKVFENYLTDVPKKRTAKESLLSLLESEIYWDVNPYESKVDSLVDDNSANGCALYREAFHEFCEAEQNTFDRSRSIILVKQ